MITLGSVRAKLPVLQVFIRHYLFWLLVFFIQRLTFILYYSKAFSEAGFNRGIESFWHGLQLDISLSGYFAIIPFVLLIVQYLVHRSFFETFMKWYTWILIIITILISGGDLGIYENWGVKLNYRAITMLAHPAEAFETVKSAPLLWLALAMLTQCMVCWLLYKFLIARINVRGIYSLKRLKFSLFMLLMGGVIAITIRGGVQQIPVNESTAYFCSVPAANHAAVNTTWHLVKSFLKNSSHGLTNIYNYLPEKEAAEIVQQLYTPPVGDSTKLILAEPSPNIMFIQLESFTADVVKELGGDSSVTPRLSELIKEGLLFTDIYSSGVRTDQGIVALLSGFPAQPQTSIIYQPDKIEHLPFISLELKKKNYQNYFFYGGELSFGRFNTIAYHAGFDKIIGEDDFADSGNFGKWGADDRSLFQKVDKELAAPKQPFFSYVITSSSHEPFNVPMPPVFTGSGTEQKFRNACYFTDKSLGEFIDAVKNRDWYKHTLFVLVADHGHLLPRYRKFDEPARYHIPLLFFGEVLKQEVKGKRINTLGSQTDVVNTIAAQLQLNTSLFPWSNNLLASQRHQFAFYTFDDGFGWLTPGDTIIFDNRAQKLLHTRPVNEVQPKLTTGKAYMQMVYNAFLKY